MRKFIIALYIRLSIEDTKVESFSVQNQKLRLRQYAEMLAEAEELDIEILEFVDNGYSGTNFERPAVQELLELVRQHKVDCIIIKDFSRFGRNSIETGYFIERVFPLYRTRFISIDDHFDTINFKGDTGGMEVAFKYLINEYYSRDLSIKSKSAKYAKMKRGEYQSEICCYGYKKGANNRLEIDTETAPVIKMIFDMSLAGNNAQQIVQALYDHDISTPGEYKASKGHAYHDISRSRHIWQRSAVLRILSDERYIGTYIMGKRMVKELGSSKVRLKDESEWFKIPNHHPAIIDKAIFDQVQAQLLHFKCDKKNFSQYPLRGKVVCGCCNHVMYRSKKEPVYRCRFTKVDKTYQCHNLCVKETELENLLFEIITKQAAVILNISNISNFGELELQLKKKSEYENLIKNCLDNKRALYEQYMLKEIDIGRYKELKAECDAELNNLKRIHSSLSVHTAQMQMDNAEKTKRVKMASDISSEESLTQALVEMLIDKVYIYPGNCVEISWKLKDFCG